jgi:hypothetical protein
VIILPRSVSDDSQPTTENDDETFNCCRRLRGLRRRCHLFRSESFVIVSSREQPSVLAESRAEDTNCAVVIAFDVQTDGALTNQREFGKLRGGQAGDGSAVDAEGRLYVATGSSVDVFAANGEFLGSIPGPQGLHGTFFGGRDKKTLYGIVFYGTWGTASARNQVIAIPTIAQGYTGRAK